MADNKNEEIKEELNNIAEQSVSALENALPVVGESLVEAANNEDVVLVRDAAVDVLSDRVPRRLREILAELQQQIPSESYERLHNEIQRLTVRDELCQEMRGALIQDIGEIVRQGGNELIRNMNRQGELVLAEVSRQGELIVDTVSREGAESRALIVQQGQFLGKYLVDIAGSVDDVKTDLAGIRQDIGNLATEVRANLTAIKQTQTTTESRMRKLFNDVQKIIWLLMCYIGKMLVFLHRLWWTWGNTVFSLLPGAVQMWIPCYIAVCSVIWASLEWILLTMGLIDVSAVSMLALFTSREYYPGTWLFDMSLIFLGLVMSSLLNIGLRIGWDNIFIQSILKVIVGFGRGTMNFAQKFPLIQKIIQGYSAAAPYATDLVVWFQEHPYPANWIAALVGAISNIITDVLSKFRLWGGGNNDDNSTSSSVYIKPMLNKEQIDNLDKTMDNLLANVRNSFDTKINTNDKEIKLSKEQVETLSNFGEFWIEISEIIMDVNESLLDSTINELKKYAKPEKGGSRRRKNRMKRTKKRMMKRTKKRMMKRTKRMMKKTKKR
jgi:hypothetical protein